MRIDREYHHFKGGHLSRAEWVERFVVEALVNTQVPDSIRESSQAWELMHSSSCKAFMHVLAEKRGVDVELARVAGAVHDYYVIKTGKYKDHARLGEPLVRDILLRHGGFGDREIAVICEMVAHHSDKHIYSDIPHIELIKDADVFDCSLYSGTEFYYLTRKPLPVCREYFARIQRVREELGMPLPDSYWSLRDGLSVLDAVPDQSVRDEYSGCSPTVLMLMLWALTNEPNGADAPAVYVHARNGRVTWYLPSSVLDTRCPTAADVSALSDQLSGCIGRLQSLSDARSLIGSARAMFTPLWQGIGSLASTQSACAISLRDHICDGDFAGKLDALLNTEPGAHIVMPDGWDLDRSQLQLLELVAAQRNMAALRGRACMALDETLERFPNGRSLRWRFPSELFDCEESPSLESEDEEWLGVAWPRFERFELVVGSEAQDRLSALGDFFIPSGSSGIARGPLL